MESYLGLTVKEYLGKLSERSIVPGGGSASAVAGALGASLNLMVLSYSIKPGMDRAAEDILAPIRGKQEKSLKRLAELADEDCAAFAGLMKALQSKRPAEKEYIIAATVPLEICSECVRSFNITAELAEHANRNLLSDIGCAGHMLRASFQASRINVEINLKYIKDTALVKKTVEDLLAMQKTITEDWKKITDKLGGIISAGGKDA